MKAWQLIEQYGWIQGEAESPRGFCTAGAIYKAYETVYARFEVYASVRAAINDSIVTWNDRPGRTKEEVITILKQVEGGAA